MSKKWLFLIWICFLITPTFIVASPKSYEFEIIIVDNDIIPLSGVYNIKYEIISSNNQTLFQKKFKQTILIGKLSVKITPDDNIDPSIFNKESLSQKITITSSTFSDSTTTTSSSTFSDTFVLDFYSNTRALVSYSTNKTHEFYNKNLISINEASLNISIATLNHKEKIKVDGLIKATALIGDASQLLGLNYVRWEKDYKKLFYTKGNVGIGTKYPSKNLHLVGSANINENLSITNELISTFSAEASEISNLNASNITHGHINSTLLFGDYPLISGIGIVSGNLAQWQGSIIQDSYVSNQLVINDAIIKNPRLNGSIILKSNFLLSSDLYKINFQPKHWALNQNSTIQEIILPQLSIKNDIFEYTSSFNIQNDQKNLLTLDSNGQLNLSSSSSNIALNISKGLRIGNTQDSIPGVIRLNQIYEGYRNGQWKRLDTLEIFRNNVLYPENNLTEPSIIINANGNIGFNRFPIDNLTVSGNVVFLGSSSAENISNIGNVSNPNYVAWIANKHALRIGTSLQNHQMWSTQSIGLNSVALGHNSAAIGTGSISINYSGSNTSVIVNGDYSIIAGSKDINHNYNNTVILSSYRLEEINTSGIIFSTSSAGSRVINLKGDNITVLNGIIFGLSDNDSFNNVIMGGYLLHSPIGNNSFLWDYSASTYSYEKNHDNSFYIGPSINVGINITQIAPTHTIAINGTVMATAFEGMSSLTGNIYASHLTIMLNGVLENKSPTINKSPFGLYKSDEEGILPNDIATSSTIADGINGIIGDNFKPYSINSDKLMDLSLIGENFASGSITQHHLNDDILNSLLISDITSNNIGENEIDESKLATNSIGTIHFKSHAVTTADILNTPPQINAPYNNIAEHVVTSSDLKDEQYISKYFSNQSATGTNIAPFALYTELDPTDGSIISTYFNDNSVLETHINAGAISNRHIPTNSVSSRMFGNKSVDTIDITINVVADDRTVSGAVFIGRHFVDNALTTSKFFDNPITNFQIESFQISNNAVISSTITNNAILLNHITPNSIIGRHIATESVTTSKFSDGSIESSAIATNAVTTLAIRDQNLLAIDFSFGAFHGIHFMDHTLTTRELDNYAINDIHLAKNSIESIHIVDKSLSTKNFDVNAFTIDKFTLSAITSDNLAVNAIIPRHFGNLQFDAYHFKEQGLSWQNFLQPPTHYFPEDKFEDNTLENDKFLPGNIPVEKFKDSSITAADMNIPTFSVDKLKPILTVDKGGTGMSSINPGELIFSEFNGTTTTITQNNFLRWNHISNYFTLGNFTGTVKKLNVGGHIFIENGALILKKHPGPLYTFISLNSNALQLSNELPLSSTTTNMGVKAYNLYAKNSVSIRTTQNINNLNLATALGIGQNFKSFSPLPDNGLIIEGTLQIGQTIPQPNPLLINDILDVSNQVGGNGKITGVSDNVAIITTLPAGSSIESPIIGDGGTIFASGNVGIEVTAVNEAIVVTINGGFNQLGLHGNFNLDGGNSGSGIQSSLTSSSPPLSTSLNAYLGYSDGTINTGIYVTEPNSNLSNNYSAYINGNMSTNKLTNKGITPTSNLDVKSLKMEGKIIIKSQDMTSAATIDWNQTSIASIVVNNVDRTILFPATPLANDRKLLLKVTHTGTGGIISWPTNVKWYKNYTPELTRINGAVDILTFTYIKSEDQYYGAAAYNFL